MSIFKHILVATDASTAADKAVALALKLAGPESKVTALMVVPDYTTSEFAEVVFSDKQTFDSLRRSLVKEGQRRLDAELDRHGDAARAVERHVVIDEQPHVVILQQAAQLQCDAIVMGSRGRSALRAVLLGSQTAAVIAEASVPVIVVK
jgi:nucleotide-binding universal stress UspA family protein